MGAVRRHWGKLFALATIAGLGVCWLFGTLLTGSTNRDVPPPPPPAERITLSSELGIQIAGDYWRAATPEAPAILLLHGNGGHRGNVTPTAQWLADEGFAVLAIDLRGHGQSSAAAKSFGLYEARDAHAALDWLKKQHPKSRTGVIGFSLGGAAALIGEKGPLNADVFVLEAMYLDIRRAIGNRVTTHAGWLPAMVIEPLLSYQSWLRYGVGPGDLSPIKTLEKVKAPVMIVGGGEDAYTPPEEMQALFRAARGNGEIWILEGLSHDQVVSRPSPEFGSKLLRFLQQHLKKG